MITRKDMIPWVITALKSLGGSGRIADVCKFIWDNYEKEIRASGKMVYIWQYDVRWAAQTLRDKGICKPAKEVKRGIWALN